MIKYFIPSMKNMKIKFLFVVCTFICPSTEGTKCHTSSEIARNDTRPT